MLIDARYQQDLTARHITLDTGQTTALAAFSKLNNALTQFKGWHTWFAKPPLGIYCFGSVGRGKTLLMDLFFQHLPRKDTHRIHFHAFMRDVHAKMHALAGEPNPLDKIAKAFAQKIRVLCLDEMMVDDVADAMILATLFGALHKEGVVLVTTSNTAPDDLYRNGVQRQNFLPTIDLIKKNCAVVDIGLGKDYRVQTLMESGVYFTPLNTAQQIKLMQEFERLTNGHYQRDIALKINDHDFTALATSAHIVWFSFAELCQKPRAYPDYLKLAQQFKIFFLTDMPICHARNDAAIRRFVHLIDVLYDAKIALIMSAEVDVPDLYQGHTLKKEFTRTQSRLLEMRTPSYWTQLNR